MAGERVLRAVMIDNGGIDRLLTYTHLDVTIVLMRGHELQPLNQAGNGEESRFPSPNRTVLGIGGTLLVAGAVAFSAGPTESYSQPPPVQEHVMHIPARDLLVPPEIKPETYAAVDRLLQAPEDPAIAPLTAQMRVVDLSVLNRNYNLMPFSAPNQEKLEAQVRTEIAAKTGLTVYDPTPITDRLRADLALSNDNGEYLGGSMHVSEYLRITQEFASKYGVTVRFANEADGNAAGLGFTDPQPIENYNDTVSKTSLINMITALGELPKEAITLAQLENIVLYDGKGGRFGGFAKADQHSIVFGLGGRIISKDNVRHEYGHLVSQVLNGYAEKDPEYDKLGDGQTSEIAPSQTNALRSEQNKAIASGDTAKACSIDTKIVDKGKDIDAFSDYGTHSHDENLAEGIVSIGMSDSYTNALARGPSSKLYQRLRNIYARLYQSSKPLAEFFSRTTPHIKHFGPVTKACLTGNWSQFTK